MSFFRQSLLKPEVEEELKVKLGELWLSKKSNNKPEFSGQEIAEMLKFGKSIIVNKKETNPYAQIKPEYIFFYRRKFNLPLRKKPSFGKTPDAKEAGLRKTRYKVRPEDLGLITTKAFIKLLNTNVPQYDSFYYKRARSYLIVLFWTPLRSSEVYERTIDDFEITDTKVIIHLLRKKKSHEVGDPDEPAEINREFPLVEELVSYLKSEVWKYEKVENGKIVKDKKGKTVFNQRPWEISHDTALNYAKELSQNLYSHYFRFRYLTMGASNPEVSIAELKAKSRLTLPALEHYLMAPKALEQSYNRKMLKQLRQEGLIKKIREES